MVTQRLVTEQEPNPGLPCHRPRMWFFFPPQGFKECSVVHVTWWSVESAVQPLSVCCAQVDNTCWKSALICEIKPHSHTVVFLESSSAVALCRSVTMVDLSVAKFENFSYILITIWKKKKIFNSGS